MEEFNVDLQSSLCAVSAIDQNIAIFDFGNVAVRRDYKQINGVRILAGCANGFEPAFSCYVGKGMLTAAIQGSNSVAPNSKLILRTIRELSVNHDGGILVLVQGDSGNLFNFGIAVERAKNDSISVKLLVANENTLSKHRQFRIHQRGSPGIILLIKIAGAQTEKGLPITTISDFCTKVIHHMVSSFSEIDLEDTFEEVVKKCGCPNQTNGQKRSKLSSPKVVCHELLNDILQEQDMLVCETNVVLLLNNGGGVNKAYELAIVKEIINKIQNLKINIVRFYVGNYITLETRRGVHLTILTVFDDSVVHLLDEPCKTIGWKEFNQYEPISSSNLILGGLRKKIRLSPPIQGPRLDDKHAHILELSVQFACDALISCERQLNLVDSERGDGDAGTRLRCTAEVLLKRLRSNKLYTNYPFTFFASLSKILELSVGGTTGSIYSIFFEAAARSFGAHEEDATVSAYSWLIALETAAESVKKYGAVEFGDQTMYDPIYGCCVVVRKELDEGTANLEAFSKGVATAENITSNTVLPNGKFPDAGAHAVAIWMRAVFEGVKLRCV